jgi:hypothetical protein
LIRDSLVAVGFFVALSAAGFAATHATIPHRASVNHNAGWMARGANRNHTWMYLSGFNDNVVNIYDMDKLGVPMIGQIKQGLSGPAGIVLDSQGTLYVANFLGLTVTVYPAGATSPSLTLRNSITLPVGVAVDANRNVYVSNSGSAPSILIYPPGGQTPSQTITSSLLIAPNAIFIDSAGDVYVSDEFSQISEIPAGSQQLVSLGLQNIHNATGVFVDPITENLFVATLNTGSAVHVFLPGHTTESYQLTGSDNADFITIGAVRGKTYLFAPFSPGSTVRLYRHERKRMYVTLSAPSGPRQVAIKPPTVP